MRGQKKLLAVMVSCAVALGTVVPLPLQAAQIKTAESGMKKTVGVTVKAAGNQTPSYTYGQEKALVLQVTNNTKEEVQDVLVKPQVNAEIDKWPFEIENTSYEKEIEKIAAGESKEVRYQLTARENVASKYYTVKFDVSYGDTESVEQSIFVKMTAKQEEKPTVKPLPTPEPEAPGAEPGFSNGEPIVTGGGSESGPTSIPRVIVTGFSTDPAEVKAGSNFKLIVHLKNTSKTTAVKNMLFDFNAPSEGSDAATTSPAFLPSSGSSTVYLDGIGANGTKDIAIDLNAKADLVQKPYSIEMSMKYEDGNAAQFESSSSISVPVKQEARFEFSEFEMSSDSVEVGSEVNVMCNLYNLGRVKLYNLKAKFEGEGIKSGEVFVGNVEPGATAVIDGMITGESETSGDGKVKMIITYEDESGVTATAEKELTLYVTPPMEENMDMMPEEMMEEPKKGVSMLLVIPAVLLAAGIAAGVIIRKKKNKKRLQEEEEMLEDELDRLTENEQR